MPTIKQYEHSGNPPIPDELATCIAFLQAAKLRAEAHICNPFTDTSWLEEPEQKLIDIASESIDLAVANARSVKGSVETE